MVFIEEKDNIAISSVEDSNTSFCADSNGECEEDLVTCDSEFFKAYIHT